MTSFSLQHQALEPAWFAALDPRTRLLAALLFTLIALCLSALPPLLFMLVMALFMTLVLGCQWRLIIKRMLAFEGFMVLVLLFLPFTVAGEPWFTFAGMDASYQGLTQALVILLRGNAVVLALLALVGSMEPVKLGYALAGLGLPEKLVQLFMMTVRYIGVLFDEHQRLRTAMKARAFVAGSNWHTWRSYGHLLGMLLVRSMERAQRISGAMRCRGFNGKFHLLMPVQWCQRDTAALTIAVLLFLLPLEWQWWQYGF
ncbi:cobalt ECF transporter T component CbiQ [Shewanella dokdonensis]|uniref:Cobalt ECF transporter T component CbiQ n=1 Tax=Shewanella dokdonensis TaxID=712036 RepID=A0ABX8DDN1_9GAMM|nr:cobalt ECF transporter T component CbiQ [Shewanella dokdonensis]MCL1073343.1 cobalt ECF transporter T component CbiQ [Shewanella dokdonensis]QVK22834.1 cobalt ECF transporter T component CbiQ [Shewanella dokdonensis]